MSSLLITNAKLFQERTRVFHKHKLPLFSNVVCYILSYALDKILEQNNLIGERSHIAGRRILNRTMELPFCHRIRQLLETSQSLTTGDFHLFWHMDQDFIREDRMTLSPLNVVRKSFRTLGPHHHSQAFEGLDQMVALNILPASNPDVQRPTGRPSRSTSSRFRSTQQFSIDSSHQRYRSGFELATANNRERRGGICKGNRA